MFASNQHALNSGSSTVGGYDVSSSVWTDVSQDLFDKDVRSLIRPNRSVGDARVYPNPADARIGPHRSLVLPFAMEKELADDLAFVLRDSINDSVTAVAVHVRSGDGRLCITMAANTGVPDALQAAVEDVIQTLEDCANQRVSKAVTQELLFHRLVLLNLDRIAARFRCNTSQQDASNGYGIRFTSKKPPTGRVLATVEGLRNQHKAMKRGHVRKGARPEEFESLRSQLASLHDAFERLNNSTDDLRIETMKKALQSAHEVCFANGTLPSRLQRLGMAPDKITNSRPILDLIKIANYFRVSGTLTALSRAYHHAFSRISIEYIPATPEKRFIHAEIQILLHLESNHTSPTPRVIGVSKAACFVCDAFIQRHGRYYISKTHGRLYPNWTLPARVECDGAKMARLRGALKGTHEAVRDALTRLEERVESIGAGLDPPESRVNSTRASIRTASVATLPLSEIGAQEEKIDEVDVTRRRRFKSLKCVLM